MQQISHTYNAVVITDCLNHVQMTLITLKGKGNGNLFNKLNKVAPQKGLQPVTSTETCTFWEGAFDDNQDNITIIFTLTLHIVLTI